MIIDCDLNFNVHIKKKCGKANAKLQALRRISKFLTEECRLTILQSFIVSQFMYCTILFHFSGKYFRDRMEKVLYRGLKFVFNDYDSSFDALLNKANMDSLHLTREKTILSEIHKFTKGVGPKYMGDIFQISKTDSRKGTLLKVPRCRTTTHGLHSLRFLGPRLWNGLGIKIKKSDTTNFKSQLKDFKGVTCRCALCR